MKKSILFFVVFILTACASAPQVTVMAPSAITVTLTPPISTPTLHPEFAALQQTIADSGSRFTLGADGLLYDGETPIPGITVTPDGTMTLTVNGETVTLDPADVDFDDEKGITIDGYEWDEETGAWVGAESPAMQQTNTLLDQYHIDPETVTMTEEGGAVNVIDNETGTVLIRTIGTMSKYDLKFAINTVAASSCESTDIKPTSSGYLPHDSVAKFSEYRELLFEETNFPRAEGQTVYAILIDKAKQCWGITNGEALAFRDQNKVALKLSVFKATLEEIRAIQSGK